MNRLTTKFEQGKIDLKLSAKLVEFDRLLAQLKNQNKKVLVFVESTMFTYLLTGYFNKASYSYCVINAYTTTRDLNVAIHEFKYFYSVGNERICRMYVA